MGPRLDAGKQARTIYESGEYQRMNELAEILESDGFENSEVLAHCRMSGCEIFPWGISHVHFRGCWVIDLLLGL